MGDQYSVLKDGPSITILGTHHNIARDVNFPFTRSAVFFFRDPLRIEVKRWNPNGHQNLKSRNRMMVMRPAPHDVEGVEFEGTHPPNLGSAARELCV